MQQLNPKFDLEDFWAGLRQARRSCLMLDYDGTLAPFRVRRDRALPYRGVAEVLRGLIAAERTKLVVVSGRSARQVAGLLGLERPPEIWGSHGAERLLPDGGYSAPRLGAAQRRMLDEAAARARSHGWGGRLEPKPAGLALHWRGLSEAGQRRLREESEGAWRPLTRRAALALHAFDGGWELRLSGVDKGRVVRAVLGQAQTAYAAYLGDDLTDEDAFEAIKGRGLGVLVRREPRLTRADIWLQPPGQMLAFLRRWARSRAIA